MPPWAIYQKHLNNLHYGLPLWDPTPKNSLEIIEGSVLYPGIGGTFSVLFNTRKDRNDSHWQPHGVPVGFKTLDEEHGPLVVDGPRTVFGLRGWNCRSVECEREVSGEVRGGASINAGVTIAAGGGYRLTCKKSSGAVLALDHHPKTTYIESSAHISSYMSRHHASWLEMANSQSPSGLGLGLSLEDLYFVSGTTKVPQWFIGVFEGEDESEKGGHLECTVSDVFNLAAQSSDVHTVRRSPVLKKGPLEVPAQTGLRWDQCIFIHYYKMKRRLLRIPKIIKAAAGPHELPQGEPDQELPAVLADDDDDDGEMEVYIEQKPGRSKMVDPVDDLLDYILDHTHAELAMASNRDIAMLFQGIPWDMRAALLSLDPNRVVISVNKYGVGRIHLRQPGSSSALQVYEHPKTRGAEGIPVDALKTEGLDHWGQTCEVW